MASKDLIQKVASEIAASSTRSPTAAGQAKPAAASAELIDAINQTFALFQVNYHNQYYAAFGDNTKSENLAKKLWLSKLEGFGGKAYQEACNKPSPKAEQQWSHAVVYLAGRDCGWHLLANEIERKALPAFTDIYQQYCDRVIAGEAFTIEPPEALPESPQVPATKKHNLEQLDQLKQLLS
jgi:hypothetical protein